MRRFATTIALFVLSLPLSAQRYDDAITVNVVEVPVHVERFGEPIAGLTRDDFELFVNGKPQAIEYFDVIDDRPEVRTASPEVVRTQAPARTDLKRRRLVVLLFDISGSLPHRLHDARAKALEFVDESSPSDTYAVATIGMNGVRFIVPFTTDRVAVRRAIGTLAGSEAADPFRVATLDFERSSWRDTVGGAESSIGGIGGERLTGFPSSLAPLTPEEYWEREQRVAADRKFMRNLTHLAERLAPLSGLKHVALLTGRHKIDDLIRYIEPALRLHERYQAANVILDAVDIRPPWAPGAADEFTYRVGYTGPPPVFGLPHQLALETGGTVSSSLASLQRRNSVTYILGFQPSLTPAKTNSIRVRVKERRRFTEVRYRQSYTLGGSESKDNSLFLADTLLNDIPHRGVTLDLDVQGRWVAARIPGEELLAHPADRPLPLDVFLYVFDERGRAVAWRQMRIDVDLVKGREFLEAHPYAIRQEFKLAPGRYSAKALVRIDGTDLTGFRRADFVVQ